MAVTNKENGADLWGAMTYLPAGPLGGRPAKVWKFWLLPKGQEHLELKSHGPPEPVSSQSDFLKIRSFRVPIRRLYMTSVDIRSKGVSYFHHRVSLSRFDLFLALNGVQAACRADLVAYLLNHTGVVLTGSHQSCRAAVQIRLSCVFNHLTGRYPPHGRWALSLFP